MKFTTPADQVDSVLRALAELPERTQSIVIAANTFGNSYEDVGEMFSISRQRVGKIIIDSRNEMIRYISS